MCFHFALLCEQKVSKVLYGSLILKCTKNKISGANLAQYYFEIFNKL